MKVNLGNIPLQGPHGMPIVSFFRRIGRLLEGKSDRKFTLQRVKPGSEPDRQVRQIINLLNYAKARDKAYNGQSFPAGYQTLEICGRKMAGQRNPRERLSLVPLDFTGKTVLDIGCAQGGMLFEIAAKIRYGVGIDCDAHMINGANRIRSYNKANNLDFYVFDLEKEDLAIIGDLIPDEKVDVAFLLSVCLWIRNWKQVIGLMPELSENLLFESNGSREQQEAQVAYLKTRYRDVRLLSGHSEDDVTQRNRRLYLCE